MEQLNFNYKDSLFEQWIVEEKIWDGRYLGKCEAIFSQGNGYIGVRNALEERYVGEKRNTFIAGTFNKAYEDEVTELPNVPDVTYFDIVIDGESFSLSNLRFEDYSRTINLKTGETSRICTWITKAGKKVYLRFGRFVSLENEHLMASKISIQADEEIEIKIVTGIDGEVTNSGASHFCDIRRRVYDERIMEFLAKTSESKVEIGIHSWLNLNKEVKIKPIMGRRTLFQEFSTTLKENENFSIEKISLFHSSRDKEAKDISVSERGLNLSNQLCKKKYEALLKESTDVWSKYWEISDIKIEAENTFYQLALRFAMYHLNIMTKKNDSRMGIGAKGLSGEGYKGHSFWDTEIFILPFFILTNPKQARNLLEYRYKLLEGARRKARDYGYLGAMYPWESAWVTDGEVTPLYMGADIVTGEITKVWTGMIEHHISADIAYAIEQYFIATKDIEFMKKFGYEMIIDIGYFWASRLEYNVSKKQYEILDVIGPDEYKEHVDNNAYTNYMAYYSMELALKNIEYIKKLDRETYKKLDESLGLEKINKLISERLPFLYLPKPNNSGIIPQSDTFLELKELDISPYKNSSKVLTIYNDFNTEQLNQYMVSKQGDTIMLFFLLKGLFDDDVAMKNFVFYESKTLHDSSLSKSSHSILASEYRLEEMALKLFEGSLTIDLSQEMSSSNEGIHSASLGGIWSSVTYGFGGIRIFNEKLYMQPYLPSAIQSVNFKFFYEGNLQECFLSREENCIQNLGSNEVIMIINKKEVNILPGAKYYFRNEV